MDQIDAGRPCTACTVLFPDAISRNPTADFLVFRAHQSLELSVVLCAELAEKRRILWYPLYQDFSILLGTDTRCDVLIRADTGAGRSDTDLN